MRVAGLFRYADPVTPEMSAAPTRLETDGLGQRELPAEALYGINTLRALDNFPLSGRTIGYRRHGALLCPISHLGAHMADLFDRLTVRRTTFRNRICISPMQQYCAGDDGRPTLWHFGNLLPRALGGRRGSSRNPPRSSRRAASATTT